MNLLDVKHNLNKKILFTDPHIGICGKEYLLTAVIAEKSESGDFVYTVKLADINANSTVITTLDKIEEVQ